MLSKLIKNKVFASFIFSLIFLIISLLTLKDYGVSWDSAAHYFRGQAYLHYFLTGKLNYDDLPKINLQGTNGNPKNIPVPRRSIYQPLDFPTAEYYLKSDSGHPPLNDILAALSNFIFYQKLGLLEDLFSHNMFIVFCSSITVFVVSYFMLSTFGIFPALVSFLSLITYPLFWSESHFNIKDPVETAFFSLAILAFYKSIKDLSLKWEILFIAFFSFALGVKFNILFLPFTLILYIVYLIIRKLMVKKRYGLKKIIPYILVLILLPLISLVFLHAIWPYLRESIPQNLINILKYYKNIGTGQGLVSLKYYLFGFNLYPVISVICSTPPLSFLLSLFGIVAAFVYSKKLYAVSILWLLWFLVPILRVVIPGTSIYGGVRQIFEYIPALALLSGIGAKLISDLIHNKFRNSKYKLNVNICYSIIISLFIFPIITLIKMYPNENTYFNFFIGGLSGAKNANFPYWGNSFGNVYKQGIDWINKNAPKNSKLTLIQGNITNTPIENIRGDISFHPRNFSGIEKDGEYIMELTYNNPVRIYHYMWEYVENFLIPVYEIKVDGVTILTIWKNDIKYNRDEYKVKEYQKQLPMFFNHIKTVTINLDKNYVLSRLRLNCLDENINTKNTYGYVETSLDEMYWTKENDALSEQQNFGITGVNKENIIYYFAGRKARYIRTVFLEGPYCRLSKFIDLFYLDK